MKAFNLCIVGGGSTFTLGFLKSFVRLREEFPLKKLVLFDIDAERQEPIGKYGEILFRERFPELDFSYTTDCREAYEGMDFVFMQMRAGGLPMRAKDEHIPPFVIFSDATLWDMAALKPDSLEAMSDIKGVGSFKLHKYGRQFVSAIQSYIDNH